MKAVLAAVFSLVFSQPAHAGKFANQFVEFEMPSEWVCLLEGAEWVCQNQQNADKKKDAIIILAAKIQGDQDTLDQYLAYLKSPKVFNTPQGKSVTSEVRFAQNRTIQDHPWVDALHLESEIPGFYTRYLATVKDGIGILVTYSVNKNKYQDYNTMFDTMVKSLKAFRREGGLNAAPANSDLFKNAKVPVGMDPNTVFGGITGASDAPVRKKAANPLDDPMIFYGGVALVGIIAIMILKKVRGGKK
ncbi:MAG: hypothetical protein JST80_10740 [Bdellovibrionales bacterium]|nr:hypothetical protein [Bdellovibrionales bacterium]